jgi:DNA-binding Lrp family transcriptional regulator
MQVPEEVLDKGLTPRQYFLLAHLYRNVDRWGEVNLTSEELEQLTNTSRTTVWRDMTALEEAGLVDTYRTRRDFNKFSKNRYTLIAPCFQPETEPCFTPETSDLKTVSLCFPPETSTADYVDSNKLLTKVTTLESNTSYLIYNDASGVVLEKKKPKREKKMVNKWQDDDDIGGFGLLDGEVPASQRQKPISKRDPKTRHNRPQHEWTSLDVASEFASRMYDKVRGIPGLVNVQKLAPILSKYRRDYGLTSVMELEVMDMLLGDDRKLVAVKKDPTNAYRIFLKMLSTHNQKAIANLGLNNLDEAPREQYVYASDGKKFDNSMPGRRAMKDYEQKLGATA